MPLSLFLSLSMKCCFLLVVNAICSHIKKNKKTTKILCFCFQCGVKVLMSFCILCEVWILISVFVTNVKPGY